MTSLPTRRHKSLSAPEPEAPMPDRSRFYGIITISDHDRSSPDEVLV